MTTDLNGCFFGEEGRDVAVQPDGKILLAGATCRAGFADSGFGLIRYNPDGTLDASFGTGGSVTANRNGIGVSSFPSNVDRASGMALQSDGRIVLTGTTRPPATSYDVMLMRFNSDGTLDTTFDTDGIATADVGFEQYASDVLIQPDGKILVGGSQCCPGSFDLFAARFNADGTLDTTFGSSGFAVLSLSAGNDFGRGIALQADGKIVLTGNQDDGNSSTVVRLNADGTLDGTFGTAGIATVDAALGQEAGVNVSIQSDGKIVVSGFADTTSLGAWDYLVFRLDGSGTLDPSFGTGGIVTTDVSGGTDFGYDLLILSNGQIAVSGGATGAALDFRVVLYNSDGSLDSGFGTGGISEAANFGQNDQGFAIALQADGNFVVGGGEGIANFAIARYIGPPTAPPDSDGDGVADDDDLFVNSNTDPTVAIGGCNSGVTNVQVGGGANMNDLISAAADDATNHGAFVSAVSKLANQWKKDGLISGKEKAKITSCAARSEVGK